MQSFEKQESASDSRRSINIIAFTGYATAGKDVAADALVSSMGFDKIGFSDPIYDIAYMIDPWIWYWFMPCKLSKIVDAVGWTKAKKIKSIRKILQDIGEGGRRFIGEDVWVDALERNARKDCKSKNRKWLVVTNVRHPNEAKRILELDGVIWKIERPGVGPVNDHVSDKGLAFEYASKTIVNNGSIEQLQNEVIMHASHYLGQKICDEILDRSEFASRGVFK